MRAQGALLDGGNIMNARTAKTTAIWLTSVGIFATTTALVWSLYDQVIRYL